MRQKMNSLLAVVEHATASVNRMIEDYTFFFKNKQSMFRGFKKTFVPRDGYFEEPSKMGTVVVTTTVDEKLDWFVIQFKKWLESIFSVEATNSSGAPTVEFIVDGINFGKLTALDLMRLKNILTQKEFVNVLELIPVRSDSEVWIPTTNPEYSGRAVFETELIKGVTRTTETEDLILKDPNLDPTHLPNNYQARVTTRKKTVETGDYTQQLFTGEWTQRQRAELLRKRSNLLEACIKALKDVNDVETEDSHLNVDNFVDYLFKG